MSSSEALAVSTPEGVRRAHRFLLRPPLRPSIGLVPAIKRCALGCRPTSAEEIQTRLGCAISLCLVGRMVRAAMRATNCRGASRGALVSSQSPAPPVTVVLCRRSTARSAAFTTRSGGTRFPTCAFSPATSKKPVSVDPGQIAVTRTPVPRVSAHNASVNESTKALVAP